ncbi:MAG: SPOR domain-containing protein, partial [Woeseiaceae bacterium]
SDRALKERIIGAVVLVFVAVLVVPIFLDGPPDEQETVSTSVTLPGQSGEDRQQQTIVLNRDRSEPVPATRAESTPATATPTVAATQSLPGPQAEPADEAQVAESTVPQPEPEVPPANDPVEEPTVPSAATSVTGMWAVQLGSFSNQQNAEKLAASLRDQGYAAFLSQLERGGTALHRVRIGPQKDRAGAEQIAAQLAKTGHKGQVVPHP